MNLSTQYGSELFDKIVFDILPLVCFISQPGDDPMGSKHVVEWIIL